MSIQLIQQYYTKVEQIIRYGGSRNESSLRKPFQDLLEGYARSKNLVLVAEVEMESKRGTRIRPDGVLKDALRQDWGFWESKDEKDKIEDEIKAKFNKGYPSFNILFEDTQVAVLFQGGERVMESAFSDAQGLDRLISRFVGYEPKEVAEFHKAIELFSAEVGGLAEVLREVIGNQVNSNSSFKEALDQFLELAKKAINPKIEMADVREMIIQHVLTEDIFMRVFDEAEFHRENVIARKLAEVAGTFYKGETKRNIHAKIAPYYETINARASQISDHHEKQKFLKALYESFYKAYNPKAADRLGIVYTPDEIVRFMIESADHLTFKHFGKTLGDKGVEILDPATGTGTFITELIEYLPPAQLEYKYDHELHCNEVSILPYYIANLNIEYTYKQKTGKFNEFENICFVDTLDNMGFTSAGQEQMNFFGIVDANIERIGRQNGRKISVVIGNPPYNAKQQNYNYQNSNRAYPDIDQRIKDTYIKQGTAQNQIVVYDMYTRFIRWASDRLDKNGMIAFISNNSFVDGKAFDGFRKVIAKEFNEVYIINMKGNAHASGEERKRQAGNVFNDQIRVGVAIYFFVRKVGEKGCRIFYNEVPDFTSAHEKLTYLREQKLSDIKFERITPDIKNNWLNKSENDFDSFIPLISKDVKAGLSEKAIFRLFSGGVKSQRDEWVYDFSRENLENKVRFLVDIYQKSITDKKFSGKMDIKWDRELSKYAAREIHKEFRSEQITDSLYRPFFKLRSYFDRHFNGVIYQWDNIYSPKEKNLVIAFNVGSAEFVTIASDVLVCQGTLLVGGGTTQCAPLYRYSESGERVENVTDWALGQFQKKYKDKKISKEDIFHYVYAVLHHPAYRSKYEINLKREFPRIPFYEDTSTSLSASFWKWAGWGKKLMELHLGYETVEPYALERRGAVPAPADGVAQITGRGDPAPTVRLMARKERGEIEIDSQTILRGVPAEAWEYRLGTYSALEWVLERYKEKKPKDPTIAEKFNTYQFAEYKESVIELLGRVCTVSVETMKIVKEMPE
ncbi:MAG: N-6 DNA methylase [Chloroflexi bacterium]|nr:N-6 DNA methylase [Chloroflexota bacterium]